MKKQFAALFALSSGLILAQDMGRVISSTPVIQQVAVPRQVCTDQQVEVQQPKSGAGAALGAIAGGAAGNALGGRGAGGAAVTMLGIVGGAMLGDRIEGEPDSEIRTFRQCSTQSFYENRTVAYNVVYEYAGKQYSVQMPEDPGPTIALQIGPAGGSYAAAPAPAPSPTVGQPPVFIQPPVIISTQQFIPSYYARPYYPSINLEIGSGYWPGHRGHRGHRHWR
jgi:uncharacterized protein YcfJ